MNYRCARKSSQRWPNFSVVFRAEKCVECRQSVIGHRLPTPESINTFQFARGICQLFPQIKIMKLISLIVCSLSCQTRRRQASSHWPPVVLQRKPREVRLPRLRRAAGLEFRDENRAVSTSLRPRCRIK